MLTKVSMPEALILASMPVQQPTVNHLPTTPSPTHLAFLLLPLANRLGVILRPD